MATITDPAWEMSEVHNWIRENGPSNVNTLVYQALSEKLGVAPEHALFFDILSAVQYRVFKIQRIRQSYNDSSRISPSLNRELTSAAGNISLMFTPATLVMKWQDLLAHYVKHEDAVAMMRFSKIIKDEHRIFNLDAAEVAAASQQIGSQIDELNASVEIIEWEKTLLVDSLTRLMRVIQFATFFSYDVALEQLMLVRGSAEAVLKTTDSGNVKVSVGKVLNALALVAALYAAPDVMATATNRYLAILHNVTTPPALTAPLSASASDPASHAHGHHKPHQ